LEVLTIGGTDVSIFTIESRDGFFQAKLSLAGKPIRVEGKDLAPQSSKLDINIQTTNSQGVPIYSFHNANSRLALAVVVVSAGERLTSVDSTTGSVHFQDTTNVTRGRFTWDKQFNATTATGTTRYSNVYHQWDDVPVANVSYDAGFSVSRIFFAFDEVNPKMINWDPVNEIVQDSTPLATSNAATSAAGTNPQTTVNQNNGAGIALFSLLATFSVCLLLF